MEQKGLVSKIISGIPILALVVIVILATLYVSKQCLIPGVCSSEKFTINGTTLLTKIQSLSSLTTTRYSYSTMITTESDMPGFLKGLYGQKQVLVAVGYITAGIDLKLVKSISVGIDNSVAMILPPPALQDCILDEGKTYIAAQDNGLFASPSSTIDQESRRFAVGQLKASALEGNILTEAQTQAVSSLENFLQLLGVEKVQLTAMPVDPNAPLPESCK